MLVRMILTISTLLLATLPAAAEDCLSLEFEAREALIRNAPTCDRAMETAPPEAAATSRSARSQPRSARRTSCKN